MNKVKRWLFTLLAAAVLGTGAQVAAGGDHGSAGGGAGAGTDHGRVVATSVAPSDTGWG
ncbi:hypothetical protein [Streptomyces roseicoloratus]|uniref:Uncharacterized protein n=1 Tax=Streptomyces roseicoloratus TaxID=2508722 RepID=A0ABY9RXQ6_9ACTN|nr:hypothetical protein [Streptomyces roseicoloratus]WMX45989.1 hypothetical protein RGF97_15615 [Streptomyces roseicoloratus]